MGDPTRSDAVRTIKQPAALDRWPRGVAYNGGFYILGTPIGLGNASKAGLRFVSGLDDPLPKRGRRIVAHRFVSSAIGASQRGLDALSLDFGRVIKLGRMELSLFPAGRGSGSAQFQVAFQENRILYCGGVCLRRPLFAEAAEVPTCDLLLLDAVTTSTRPPAPRRVAPKLLDWVEGVLSRGRLAVVGVGSLPVAFDVMWILRSLHAPIRAQRRLYECFRRIEEFVSFSPGLRRLEQRLPDLGVVLCPAASCAGWRLRGHGSAATAYAGQESSIPEWAEVAFRLGEGEDRAGMVSYVKQTKATKVALGANCEPGLAHLLAKAGITTYRVTPPEQIPLPFRPGL
jgi:hypothetical protein